MKTRRLMIVLFASAHTLIILISLILFKFYLIPQ